MKKLLERTPLFLFLLPIFFIWHGFDENYGNITVPNVLLLTLAYLGGSALLYFVFLPVVKNYIRASLLAGYLMGIYCFFGAIQDFLKAVAHPLSRYGFLLSFFGITIIALTIYLRKTTRDFFRLCLFLNSVFIIYLLIDFTDISWKIISPPASKLSVYTPGKDAVKTCADCPRPDIYFLLFDAYMGTSALKERFGYDNSDLDSFLVRNGFSIQRHSRSNYFFTPFSMASTLNMQYLDWLAHPNACTLDDYERCINMIRDNRLIHILSDQGYDMVNYSVFDLAGNPTRLDESFLPLKTKLITESTLFARMRKDMGWMLTIHKFNFFSGNIVYQTLLNTNKCIDYVKKESSLQTARPRFVYAHFYLPHAPFYFDKFGNPKKEADILQETKEFSLQAYLDYLPYAKKRVEELIGAVKKNTGGKAVIVFMSDHGFNNDKLKSDHIFSFQNQNAVYFPDGDYSRFYDGITNVNQFRVILNKLFKQNLPLIKDSTIFLFDKNKPPH